MTNDQPLIKWMSGDFTESDHPSFELEKFQTELEKFQAWYLDAQWLETDSQGAERWSNGLGEGTTHESEWFHGKTGEWLQDYSRDDESYFDDGEII